MQKIYIQWLSLHHLHRCKSLLILRSGSSSEDYLMKVLEQKQKETWNPWMWRFGFMIRSWCSCANKIHNDTDCRFCSIFFGWIWRQCHCVFNVITILYSSWNPFPHRSTPAFPACMMDLRRQIWAELFNSLPERPTDYPPLDERLGNKQSTKRGRWECMGWKAMMVVLFELDGFFGWRIKNGEFQTYHHPYHECLLFELDAHEDLNVEWFMGWAEASQIIEIFNQLSIFFTEDKV